MDDYLRVCTPLVSFFLVSYWLSLYLAIFNVLTVDVLILANMGRLRWKIKHH